MLGFDRASYSPQAASVERDAPSGLAHASFRWASDPDGYEFVHRLNLYGFRDDEWPLRAREHERVAFVGDSFVEGFGVDAEDALPVVFRAALLEHETPVETLNLGVGGADLARYARLLRDALPLFRPDDVVLVLYANDLIPVSWDPGWLADAPVPVPAKSWEPRLLHVLRERRRGRRVPRRWVEAPFSYLPAVPDPRNPWSHEAQAARLSRSVAPGIAEAMREGRFNPALADWFGWASRALTRPVDWTPHLKALDTYVKDVGGRLLLVYLPTKSQVTDRYLDFQAEYSPKGAPRSLTGEAFQVHARWLARSAEALGIPFLDLTPTLRELEANGPELYWRYDDHLRPRGQRAVGEKLAEWFLRLPRPASPRRGESRGPRAPGGRARA